jgi:23S rRNA (cytidine1920-2'-O)/16S rRNA (cytidine1409-2'-O)-methyltransferase
MPVRRRLDVELVRRELTSSRAEASSLIAAVRVRVNCAVAEKSSRQIAPCDAVVIVGPPKRFVGGGGE